MRISHLPHHAAAAAAVVSRLIEVRKLSTKLLLGWASYANESSKKRTIQKGLHVESEPIKIVFLGNLSSDNRKIKHLRA